MKKTIAAFLAAAMALALSGCAGDGKKNGSDTVIDPTENTINTPINGGASGVGGNEPNVPGNVDVQGGSDNSGAAGNGDVPRADGNNSNVPSNGGVPNGDSNNSNTPGNSGTPGGEGNNSNTPGNVNTSGSGNSSVFNDPEKNNSERKLQSVYSGTDLDMNAIAQKSNFCTEDGYYRIQRLGDDRDIFNITYVDFASKREIVLCSDSSCRHNTESCASFISGHEMFTTGIFVFDDKLWLLSTESDDEGSMGSEYHAPGYEPKPETRRAAIFRMDLDGTNREKVYEAALGDIIERNVFGDGDDLLFVVKTPKVDTVKNNTGKEVMFYGSKNRALLRFSISQNKVVERIPLDPYKNISLTMRGCTGSRLILSGIAYPDGKSRLDYMDILAYETGSGHSSTKEQNELSNNCEIVFFTLDIDTKELKEVFRIKRGTLYSYLVYKNELYIRYSDDTVSAVDVLSGTSRSVNIPNGYDFGGIFMDKLELYRIGKSDDIAYFADIDGTNITSTRLFDLMNKDRVTILAAAGKKLIVQYDEETVMRPEGGYTRTGVKLGLISIDDLVSGRRNIDRINNLDKS
ncbi:MAG: hypothetical protein K2N56_12925 [Oscillospiraceae bacterium]|nr:hypothetical protein [Oscillospiraceae bacterium]